MLEYKRCWWSSLTCVSFWALHQLQPRSPSMIPERKEGDINFSTWSDDEAENSSQGLCRCLAQQNEWMKQIGIWWRWISHGTLCPCNDVNLLFSCTSCKALEQRTCLTQCTKMQLFAELLGAFGRRDTCISIISATVTSEISSLVRTCVYLSIHLFIHGYLLCSFCQLFFLLSGFILFVIQQCGSDFFNMCFIQTNLSR